MQSIIGEGAILKTYSRRPPPIPPARCSCLSFCLKSYSKLQNVFSSVAILWRLVCTPHSHAYPEKSRYLMINTAPWLHRDTKCENICANMRASVSTKRDSMANVESRSMASDELYTCRSRSYLFSTIQREREWHVILLQGASALSGLDTGYKR